jgi:hypothetical protein
MKKACTVSPAPKLVVEQEAREGRVRCMFVQWPLLPVGEKQGGKGGTWMVGRGTKPKFSGFGEVPSTLREQAVLYALKNKYNDYDYVRTHISITEAQSERPRILG